MVGEARPENIKVLGRRAEAGEYKKSLTGGPRLESIEALDRRDGIRAEQRDPARSMVLKSNPERSWIRISALDKWTRRGLGFGKGLRAVPNLDINSEMLWIWLLDIGYRWIKARLMDLDSYGIG